jgi:hypothetical protein
MPGGGVTRAGLPTLWAWASGREIKVAIRSAVAVFTGVKLGSGGRAIRFGRLVERAWYHFNPNIRVQSRLWTNGNGD